MENLRKPAWSFVPALNFSNFRSNIRPRSLRWIGRTTLATLLIFALLLNLFSFSQNLEFFSHKTPTNGLAIEGSKDFKGSHIPKFVVKIPDQFSHKLSWIEKLLSGSPVEAAQTEVSATLRDTKGQKVENVKPEIVKDSSTVTLAFSDTKNLKPGSYVLSVEVKDSRGKSNTLTQDFTWGVLALNTNKSVYTPGEVAKIGFGVLDDVGHTICNAQLTLTIITPDNQTTTLTSQDSSIRQSGECGQNNVTNTADYHAEFNTQEEGMYYLTVKAETENGVRSIEDSFEVKPYVPFDIERTLYPTRINPKAPYQVQLTIHTNQDFRGEIVEEVPNIFEILNPKSETLNKFEIQSTNDQNHKSIIWHVDWEKGQTHTLGYTIKFPPESPQFYAVGPLELRDSPSINSGSPLFLEARRWQIASDSPGTLWLESGTDATQGLEWWNPIGNAPVTDTAQKNTGPRSIKANGGASNLTSLVRKSGILADAGRRICAYVNFTNKPANNVRIILARAFSLADVIAIRITSGGVLQLDSNGTQIGSNGSTLSTGTWYHLCLTYTITSSTVFDLRVFKDSSTADISVTNSGTLAATNSDTVEIGWGESPGANNVMNFDDIYIDDSTANTYPGDIRVTAKLPSTTNANNFDATLGTGVVNQRPISETDGKQDATANTPGATQNYTLETASGGDVDMSGNTIVTRFAWVWAKKGNGSTSTAATIFDNGSETSITLTTSSSLLDVITDSSSYPSNAAGIGMRAIDGGSDTFFYEGGTLIGFTGAPVPEVALALAPLSLFAPKIINAIQRGTLVSDIRDFLIKMVKGVQKMTKKLIGFGTKLITSKKRIAKRRKRKCG